MVCRKLIALGMMYGNTLNVILRKIKVFYWSDREVTYFSMYIVLFCSV